MNVKFVQSSHEYTLLPRQNSGPIMRMMQKRKTQIRRYIEENKFHISVDNKFIN